MPSAARRISGDDGPLAPSTGNADALPRPGIRLFTAVLVLCRSKPGATELTRTGRRNSSRNFPVCGPPMPRLAWSTLPIRGLSRVQTRFLRTYGPCGNLCLAPRPLATAPRRPRNRPAAARCLDGAVLGSAAFVLRYFGRQVATGCSSSIWVWTCTLVRCPNHYWPRRPDVAGNCGGRAKIPPMAEQGFVRWKPMRSGRSRGTPPGADSPSDTAISRELWRCN